MELLMDVDQQTKSAFKKYGKTAVDVGSDFIPGVSETKDVIGITNGLKEGDYATAGIHAAGLALGAVPIVGDIARRGLLTVTKAMRKKDVSEAEKLIDDPNALKAWQDEHGGKGQRQINPEDSEAAAEALYQGEITSKEARNRIKDAIPEPQEYTADQVREMMPTVTDVTGAMGKKAKDYGIIGVKDFDLKEGQLLGARLDIPAYNRYDKWVVSIHDGGTKGKINDKGPVLGYGQAIRLKNVRFGSQSKEALDIARGKILIQKTGKEKPFGKSTIARAFGEYVPEDPYELQEMAASIIESGSKEWTQVGMNPYRGSQFYDKKTGKMIFDADEMIQVGPLVLAKNAKTATISDLKEMAVRTKDGKLRIFNKGGSVPMNVDQQTEMAFMQEGGLRDDGANVDAVSGNEVPAGSMDQEVRDDIPARLSEGEYVVPADVVRYHGVKLFEDLRKQAKMGMSQMEADGRIGGEPMEAEEEPLPFDTSELVTTDSMAEGGLMGFANGADVQPPTFTHTPNTPYDQSNPFGQASAAGFELKPYTNQADGRTIMLAFYNGKPMQVIPEGFVPAAEVAETTTPEDSGTAPDTASKDSSPSVGPYIETKDRGTMKPFKDYTGQDFLDAADQLDSPLNKILSMSPLLGSLARMNHERGVEAAKEIVAERGDELSDFERIAMSKYATSAPQEKESFFGSIVNFLTGKEDTSPDSMFNFGLYDDESKFNYTAKDGTVHENVTVADLLKIYKPETPKETSQARGNNELEKDIQRRQFETTGHALTNYGNVKFMGDPSGVRDMDIFRIDDGSGEIKMVRRYEMEKALGKKNLTSKDIMNYNPAEYERVDAKDSVVDKILKVDRTELKKKEQNDAAAEARRLEEQQKKQQKKQQNKQDAAKKAYEEDRTKAYKSGSQMFRGQGGRATGGLVKKKKRR